MVPPCAPHTFANPGDEPVVLLNTFTADLYVRYFRDRRAMAATGRPMTDEAVTEIDAPLRDRARHGVRLVIAVRARGGRTGALRDQRPIRASAQ